MLEDDDYCLFCICTHNYYVGSTVFEAIYAKGRGNILCCVSTNRKEETFLWKRKTTNSGTGDWATNYYQQTNYYHLNGCVCECVSKYSIQATMNIVRVETSFDSDILNAVHMCRCRCNGFVSHRNGHASHQRQLAVWLRVKKQTFVLVMAYRIVYSDDRMCYARYASYDCYFKPHRSEQFVLIAVLRLVWSQCTRTNNDSNFILNSEIFGVTKPNRMICGAYRQWTKAIRTESFKNSKLLVCSRWVSDCSRRSLSSFLSSGDNVFTQSVLCVSDWFVMTIWSTLITRLEMPLATWSWWTMMSVGWTESISQLLYRAFPYHQNHASWFDVLVPHHGEANEKWKKS